MKEYIIFICIGTNKLQGDCLGPLVGTYLKEKFTNDNIKIFGDLKYPVHYLNIDKVLNYIDLKYKNNSIKIIIDSALGSNIGGILLKNNELYIGKGLKKNKKINGNIIIRGIVGRNYNNLEKNIQELYKASFKTINEMALKIVKSICI